VKLPSIRQLDDLRTRGIPSDIDRPFIDTGNTEENLREATKLTGEGREPAPYEWKISDAMPEQGPSDSSHKIMKVAARIQGNKRREDFADELQARSGIDAETAAAVTDHITDGPPPKVLVTRDDGTQIPPLLDRQPITKENSFETLTEARDSMRNFRDVQAAEAQELLWRITPSTTK